MDDEHFQPVMPSFFEAFKDPRFLITLLSIVIMGSGGLYVASYRIGSLESSVAANRTVYDVKIGNIDNAFLELRSRIAQAESKITVNEKELEKKDKTMQSLTDNIIVMGNNISEMKATLLYVNKSLQELSERIPR